MKKYHVYCLYDNTTPFYIGASRSPEWRLNSHRTTYGRHITMEILITDIDTREKAFCHERVITREYLDKGIVLKNKQIISPIKRVSKSYKIALSIYKKADKKAKKNKTTVANLLEDYLYDYAE